VVLAICKGRERGGEILVERGSHRVQGGGRPDDFRRKSVYQIEGERGDILLYPLLAERGRGLVYGIIQEGREGKKERAF